MHIRRSFPAKYENCQSSSNFQRRRQKLILKLQTNLNFG